MEPKIVISEKLLLAGISIEMSLNRDMTFQLWSTFMPKKMSLPVLRNKPNYCIKIYNPTISFNNFSPDTVFTKWAAVTVDEQHELPESFHLLEIPKGLYAVFIHKGPASTFSNTLQYIFTTWIPNSNYDLRDAPHFEILENHYNPEDPLAEEAVWIPIQERK